MLKYTEIIVPNLTLSHVMARGDEEGWPTSISITLWTWAPLFWLLVFVSLQQDDLLKTHSLIYSLLVLIGE